MLNPVVEYTDHVEWGENICFKQYNWMDERNHDFNWKLSRNLLNYISKSWAYIFFFVYFRE